MDNKFLTAALFYHNEGLCVIPIKPRDKAPALESWEVYQERQSTAAEIEGWFSNGKAFNVGLVHGAVSGNYVTIDFDHDAGIFGLMRQKFPDLFTGRIEQSGSGQGYHLPLKLETLPDFGMNARQRRPRGNRTWKTEFGHVNIRAQYCQTVVPPSIHPSGQAYRFIQRSGITEADSLDDVIAWLSSLAPPKKKPLPRSNNKPLMPAKSDNLIEAVKLAWPTAISVFEHFGLTINPRTERDGETRLLGHGGLLIASDDPAVWYNFSDEIGGGVIEAWGWQRFGSAFDSRQHFRQTLLEMAQSAGIDAARFYCRGDEKHTSAGTGDKNHWGERYSRYWQDMREGQHA